MSRSLLPLVGEMLSLLDCIFLFLWHDDKLIEQPSTADATIRFTGIMFEK